MEAINVFISRGTPCNPEQEKFYNDVFDVLREYDINPCVVGITHHADEQPLRYVQKLMHECYGAIIIAVERVYLSNGQEKRGGPNEHKIHKQIFPTVWNHIEAAMAYSLNLPILVIVEEGSRQEGLLEECFDWRVLPVPLQNGVNTQEFRGVIKGWSEKIHQLKKQNQLKRYLPPMNSAQIKWLIGLFIAFLSLLITGMGVAFTWGEKYVEAKFYNNQQTQIQTIDK